MNSYVILGFKWNLWYTHVLYCWRAAPGGKKCSHITGSASGRKRNILRRKNFFKANISDFDGMIAGDSINVASVTETFVVVGIAGNTA